MSDATFDIVSHFITSHILDQSENYQTSLSVDPDNQADWYNLRIFGPPCHLE